MSHVPRRRAHVAQPDPAAPVRRGAHAPLHASVIELHRMAGNRAVTHLLQRSVGWEHASHAGRGWNVGEAAVGKIRRIPLDGLSEGTSASRKDELAQRWMWDDKEKKTGHWGTEPTDVPSLSPESAKGRAIVLVPEGLDASQSIEVLVFLHGFTEDAGRPYAGWRTLTHAQGSGDSDRLRRLRQGLGANELPPGAADDAPVRDVALDQAEQQLEESGQKQLVIVLPQGGRHSQFGKAGDQNFDAAPFVAQVVSRLQTEQCWRDGAGKVAAAAPNVSRIDMAGHSGAGATLSHMASAKKPSSALTGDLVLYDAINGGELSAFQGWAKRRLDEDLAVLTDPAKSDADKLAYLQTAPKLRGYCTDAYIGAYIQLDDAIAAWFARHKKKLGDWAPCLRANYVFEYVDVDHEELMRGSAAGAPRPAGGGTIRDAIKGLHPGRLASTAACPPMPEPLSKRYKAQKKAKGR